MTGRLTPKDIQDGPYGEQPGDISNFEQAAIEEGGALPVSKAKTLALECYKASTNWINSGRRARWNDNLRAFQGLHPSGSKYLSSDYRYRSRHFRPKTRGMVRRGEAQTASAFFSNEDIVSIDPIDDDNAAQQASAEINKALLQYRLTKTIPWFLTVVGARQDTEVMGICASKQYWRYAEEQDGHDLAFVPGEDGNPTFDEEGKPRITATPRMKIKEDHPWIDLIAPENIRFDPGADWRDPINTSPYVIELIPIYLQEARERVHKGDWLPISDGALTAATGLDDDVTRRSRESGRVPGKDGDAWKPRDFDICWICENIIKWGGQDWHFLTVTGSGELVTPPRPLKEVYLHGVRPYVLGCIIPEAHKTYPVSKVELVRDLQMMTNDNTNLRFDNVKLALNPRQFIAAGKGIEAQDVRSMQPAKVITVQDPRNDVVWDRPPEVTQSAYAEQDRINMDFDELVGSFSPSTLASGNNPIVPETVGGMEHMAAPSAAMNEYELRVFAETWVEPVLRQLVKLEQAYETDAVVLGIAGNKAQLYQRFGVNQITDDLLNQELTIRVNVGMGSTNPALKLKAFLAGAQAIGQMFGPAAAMGANFGEVVKEVFACLGYKDGSRFFKPGFDPQQAMAQMHQGKGAQPDPMRLQAAQMQVQGKLQERQMQIQASNQETQMDYQKEAMVQQAETQRVHLENQRAAMELQHGAGMEQARMGHDLVLEQAKMQHTAALEHFRAANTRDIETMKAQNNASRTP